MQLPLNSNDKGKVHYSVVMFLAFIIILMLGVVAEKKKVTSVRDNIDNTVTATLFSGSVFGVEKIYDSIIISKAGGEYDFKNIYQNTYVCVEYERAFELANKVLLSNKGVCDFILEDFIVYNLGDKCDVHKYHMGDYVFESYNRADGVYTPNNIKVDATCVYIKVGCVFNTFFKKNYKADFEKSIFVEY